MYTLLQLSDLHFGDDHFFTLANGRPSLADSVKKALNDADIKVNHIVFSGDFFSHKQGEDLPLAEKGINEIKGKLNLSEENLSFVPGNHDLSWSESHRDDKFYYYNKLIEGVGLSSFKQNELPNVIWLNKEEVSTNKNIRPIFLALLDSCKVESRILAGIGDIGEKQLNDLNEKLKEVLEEWKKLVDKISDDYTLIATFHHHLLPIHEVEDISEEKHKTIDGWSEYPHEVFKARSSHTLDAVDILNQLAKLDTSLIIHGHQHKSAIVSYQNRLDHSPMLTIAASGSCSSKEATVREFFVYQIDEHEIIINRFIQTGTSRRFIMQDNKIRVHLPHISRISLTYCVEEAKQQHSENKHTESTNSEDVSDLNLILAAVASCEQSRKLVKNFFNQDEDTKDKYRFQGMYHLSGHWDLLVRFRLNQNQEFNSAKKRLSDYLKENEQMTTEGDFSLGRHINVTKETTKFSDLLATDTIKTPIRRNALKDIDEYEKRRCQRGFLFISLPSDVQEKNKLIQALSNLLDDYNEFTEIVEGVYEGTYINELGDNKQYAIVVEVFMTCAKQHYLNRINRKIEGKLSEYKLQKHTMTCYDYYEE